jgi:hypothetical protein
MAATIGKVAAVFTANTSGLTAGVRQASSSMSSMQRQISGLQSSLNGLKAIAGAQLFGSVIGGAASAVRALAGLGASAGGALSAAVAEATSLGEETSKSAVIFGESAAAVAAFARSASQIGLAESAALQATGTFGNLFTAMGLGRDQAASYATTLTTLGADLASFNNTSVEDAITALGAALRGESEPIRRFGVLLDDATLKQEALAQGLITSTTGSLTPAIRAQAAYAVILRQTAAAQGDFARTSGSLANLSRIISAQTKNVFTTLGSSFEPLYRAVAGGVSQVLTAVGPLFGQIAAGIRSSVDVIAGAIQSLIPQFTAFIGTVDGATIGNAIGGAILDGARSLAAVADYFITNSGSVFAYLSDVVAQWGPAFDLGSRVAQAFFGAAKAFEFFGNTIGGAFSDIVAGLYGAAAGIADVIPGFGDLAAELKESAKGWEAAGDNFLESANRNISASGAAFGSAFSSGVADAATRSAGPVTTALDRAAAGLASTTTAAANSAAATLSNATSKPVEVKQTVAVNVDQAVKGIDSRSQEGVAEMFRIIRGASGNVQERQLDALNRIADNTNDLGGDVAEFALP